MKFFNIHEKCVVTLVSIIVFLLLLEILLRTIGIINLRKPIDQISGNRYNDSYIILCLGDSVTYGLGALPGMDYPNQLETILNSKVGKKKFKVINGGVNGYKTTQLLDELKDTLKKGIKPDLVTLLGGGANYWNHWGYHLYLKGNTFSAFINDYLYRIRSYKLAKLLFLNIKDKIKYKSSRIDYCRKGWFYQQEGQYDEAIKWFQKGIEINPNDSSCYTGIAFSYMNKKDNEKAMKYLKKAIKLNPREITNYHYLFTILQGRYEVKLDFLNELVKDNRVRKVLWICLRR